MYLLRTVRVFGFELFHIMPMPFIGLKLDKKPLKIFEVENLIKFLNAKTEMEHATFVKNLH